MEYNYVSPEHRLYDTASRWRPKSRWDGPKQLIDTAVQCLVEGLDSPTLRILAGASPTDSAEDIQALLDATLEELNIPSPGAVSPWKQIGADGRTYTRQPNDTIRFDIRPTRESAGGHELLIYVNDVEMTRIAAGMGMDPFDVLVPNNRLVAAEEPSQVPVARCECGVYGCGSTDVTIVRDGDAVHWEWLYETPSDYGATFAADQYDAEVGRIAADHSWESAADTAARLVLERIDRTRLERHGLTVSWAAKDHTNLDVLKIALFTGNDDYRSAEAGYQVFLRFPLHNRTPREIATDVAATLRQSPQKWQATWHAIKPGIDRPPPMAGRRWRHERIR